MPNMTQRLEAKRAKAYLGGGERRIAAQHRKGKLTARAVTECITEIDLTEQMIWPEARPHAGLHTAARLGNSVPDQRRGSHSQPPAFDREIGKVPPLAQAMEPSFPVPEDVGVHESGEIPIHYDSMIAKLIVKGRDRSDAISRMREALNAPRRTLSSRVWPQRMAKALISTRSS